MAVGQIVYLHSLSSDAEQIAVHRVHLGTPQPPLHQRVKATHWRLRRPHPMAVPSIQPFYLVILSGFRHRTVCAFAICPREGTSTMLHMTSCRSAPSDRLALLICDSTNNASPRHLKQRCGLQGQFTAAVWRRSPPAGEALHSPAASSVEEPAWLDLPSSHNPSTAPSNTHRTPRTLLLPCSCPCLHQLCSHTLSPQPQQVHQPHRSNDVQVQGAVRTASTAAVRRRPVN